MRVSADNGSIRLPKSVRKTFGDEFELVVRNDRLVLVPVPDEPLEALREEARGSDRTVDDLKRDALEEALDEAGQ